jgi:hypothetical protein
MKKEKVFIVASHKHILKKDPRTGKTLTGQWEVSEVVEFVNQLRNKHIRSSTAIGDYINRTMLTGERHGMGDYNTFENYIRTKYAKQLEELDGAYGQYRISAPVVEETITDEHGNTRSKTVFDV